jgi:hypothetical protein
MTLLDEKRAAKLLVNCRLAALDSIAEHPEMCWSVFVDAEGLIDISWDSDLKHAPKYAWVDLDDPENKIQYSDKNPGYYNKILFFVRCVIYNADKTPSMILYSEICRIGAKESYDTL